MTGLTRSKFADAPKPATPQPAAPQFQTRLDRSSPFTRFLLGFSGNSRGVLEADARERAGQQGQRQAEAKQKKNIFDTATNTLKSVADQARKIEFGQIDKFRNSIQPILKAISENMEAVRPGSSAIVAPTLNSAFASIQSPEQKGAAAGRETSAELKTRLGRDPTPAEINRAAGVQAPAPTMQERIIGGQKEAVLIDDTGKEVGTVPLGPAANPTREIRNFRAPDGDQITALVDSNTGEVIQEIGRGPSVQFQPPEVPGAKAKEFAEIENLEIGTRNFIGAAEDFKDLVRKGGPAALSAAGGFASAVREGVSLFRGFAQIAGVDTGNFSDGTKVGDTTGQFDTEGKPLDAAAKKAETVFTRLGIAGTLNAQIKSDIVNLAFAAAAAMGQTGRAVSDRDYKNFVRQIGGNIGDPETLAVVIDRVSTRINRNFRNTLRVKGRAGRFPDLKTDTDPLSEIRAEREQAGTAPAPVTATNPETGERLRKNPTTGEWEPFQ